jgi:hypothetical protein
MVSTVVSLYENKEQRSVVCIGCTGFADSIILLGDKDSPQVPVTLQQGWCVHTLCMQPVLNQYFNRSVQQDSAFDKFVQDSCALNESIIPLRTSTLCCSKYLVFVDSDQSFENDVCSHSVCFIKNVQHRKFISCRDVRCKKGKAKRIENIKKLDQVCCHLNQLLKHLKFGSEDACLEDSDSDDDLSES